MKSSAAAPSQPLPRAAAADEEVVAVRVEGVRCEDSREAGPVHVGCQFWRRLELDVILGKAGLSEGARRLTLAMTLNRLIHPTSELGMPEWIRATALPDILGVDFHELAEDALYRNLDKLHEHRVAIETALADRERDLFGLDQTVFLYDVTSTYFEGRAMSNAKAQRGYWRGGRPLGPRIQAITHVAMGDLADRLRSKGERLRDLRRGETAGKLAQRKRPQDEANPLNAPSQQLADP